VELKKAGLEAEGEEPEKPKKPKRRRVFVSEPPAPSTTAVVEVSPFGRAERLLDCQSAEAAAQWDVRHWHHRSFVL